MAVKSNKTVIIKREILNQYGSVRNFAIKSGISYSTIMSALDRGIDGMGYSSVIKMCELLDLNPVDFSKLGRGMVGETLLQDKVMQRYIRLNDEGQKKALEIMDDLALIKKYKAGK